MSDIVGRLRVRQPLLGTLCDEAAEVIERLRAELDNEHIARLAAERTSAWRLRALQAEAENERLRAERDDAILIQHNASVTLDELRAEIERLQFDLADKTELVVDLRAEIGRLLADMRQDRQPMP